MNSLIWMDVRPRLTTRTTVLLFTGRSPAESGLVVPAKGR
jgi:hypothetical protein